MKEEILIVLFWYLVSWYIVKNEYLKLIFEQLGAVEGKKVTIWRLIWDNWIHPFVSCPQCSALLFVLIGQLTGWFWLPLLIALAARCCDT